MIEITAKKKLRLNLPARASGLEGLYLAAQKIKAFCTTFIHAKFHSFSFYN